MYYTGKIIFVEVFCKKYHAHPIADVRFYEGEKFLCALAAFVTLYRLCHWRGYKHLYIICQ